MADGGQTFGVHPDVLAAQQRRAAAQAARGFLDGVMAQEFKKLPPCPKVSRAPKIPRLAVKTCRACGKTYHGVTKHFSNKSKTCKKCNENKDTPAQKAKTCITCGTTYDRTCDNFLRGGRLYDNCNRCAEAKVRARIEARIARKAAA
jgi:hypothetical protein